MKLNAYLAVGENGGDGESDARLLGDHQNFGKRHVWEWVRATKVFVKSTHWVSSILAFSNSNFKVYIIYVLLKDELNSPNPTNSLF